MSSSLVPASGSGGLAMPAGRRVDRATIKAVAAVRSNAIVEAEKVRAVSFVADRAMTEVAYLAHKHVQIIGAVPLADTGCQAIRDAALLTIVGIVADMRYL